MKTIHRCQRSISAAAAVALLATVYAGCLTSGAAVEDVTHEEEAWAGDCDSSDQAGDLVAKADSGQMFDAHFSYRQTDDAGQKLTQACDLASHSVTSQGMRDVALHCSGKSQAESGYARVGARWGTSLGADSCTKDYCAAVYIQDGNGALKEVVRDIYLKDRFFCGQTSDRTDERLDVDACTYADLLGALKDGGASADDSNLAFDQHGKLYGNSAKGYTLKYKMYACGGGSSGNTDTNSGGGCDDTPPDGNSTCVQQAQWGKCGESWMQGFCSASCGRCGSNGGGNNGGGNSGGGACGDTPPNGDYSCAEQASWGKCGEAWMQGYCKSSCGTCGGGGGSACDDTPPDGSYSCSEQAGWGKCGEGWMIDGGFCRHTCGRC